MKTVNIRVAQAHLFRLVEEAAKGESFIITKAARPVALLSALHEPAKQGIRRLGFLSDHMFVPADFDRMGSAEIEELFFRAD